MVWACVWGGAGTHAGPGSPARHCGGGTAGQAPRDQSEAACTAGGLQRLRRPMAERLRPGRSCVFVPAGKHGVAASRLPIDAAAADASVSSSLFFSLLGTKWVPRNLLGFIHASMSPLASEHLNTDPLPAAPAPALAPPTKGNWKKLQRQTIFF